MSRLKFDIKFRPQIESGEYKVETGDGRSVRIISWDKKVFGGRTEIVALVPTPKGDTETVQLYCPDGTLIVASWNEKFKLFIVTPEPEMSEMEIRLLSWLSDDTSGEIPMERMKQVVKARAAELFALAEREIVNRVAKECYKEDFCIEDTVKFNEGYKLGKEVALKDLPRWRKVGVDTGQTNLIKGYKREEDELCRNGKCISLVSLEKLPGFKED